MTKKERDRAAWMRAFQDAGQQYGPHEERWDDADYLRLTGLSPEDAARRLYGLRATEHEPNEHHGLFSIGDPGGPETEVQITPWTVGSGAPGRRTWHVQRRRTWVQDGWPRYGIEQLSDAAGRYRTFATKAAAQRAADQAETSGKAFERNDDLAWREHYGRGYHEAEARGLQPWQAREEAASAAWADYEARTGRKRFGRNGFWAPEDEAEYQRLLNLHDSLMEEAEMVEDAGYDVSANDLRRLARVAEQSADSIARRYERLP